MNRVKDYYNIACLFMALPIAARFTIGTKFKVCKFEDYVLKDDEMSAMIFKKVIVKNQYTEFSQLVRDYKNVDSKS